MKTTNRFNVVSGKSLIITPKKEGLTVELQQGQDGKPYEMVVAEKYYDEAENTFKYSKRQVRFEFDEERVAFITDTLSDLRKYATKNAKKSASSTVKTFSIKDLSDDELNALERLLAARKAATSDLVLESTKTKKRK